MLQIEEVHEHLILHLDHAREEAAIETMVVLFFTIDKLLYLECSFSIIVRFYELLVSEEQAHNGVEERVPDCHYCLLTQIEPIFFLISIYRDVGTTNI